MTLEAFEEVEQRKKAAGEAYPFELNYRGVLQLKSSWEDFPVYSFCLGLSYFGLTETNIAPKLFEQVSCQAAKGYLKGNVIGFGWPRKELPSSFPGAIAELCRFIGEGGGYRQQSSLGRKDDTLDLVAWKDFTDKWPSKVLMFGQCAAGQNWEEKLGELNPEAFWDQWMQYSLVSPRPIKSFFIPHRVERGKWEFFARKGGLLFERCRIAFWAHQEKVDYYSHVAWIRELLERIAL
ncbi:MAG: hypothetical protein A2Z04_02155 [Chloroflexi bacterium RBG_16_57_9]|nr:MAG: hypothetical protein A2Z04_02155 [Chloroflexi bacterium RBG_16_57_9]